MDMSIIQADLRLETKEVSHWDFLFEYCGFYYEVDLIERKDPWHHQMFGDRFDVFVRKSRYDDRSHVCVNHKKEHAAAKELAKQLIPLAKVQALMEM